MTTHNRNPCLETTVQQAASREMYNRMTPVERVHFTNAGGTIIDPSPLGQPTTAVQTITRAMFDGMTPKQRHAFITDGGRVV